jgi:hypothetical protein
MSINMNPDRFIAFPVSIWEKAQSKEELAAWLMTVSQKEEMSPLLVVKDYLTLPKGNIPIELQLFPNGDILAVLPQTDLAAEGDNFEEAKQNLLIAVKDDYAYLSQRREALGKELSEQLKFLEEKLA